MALAEWEWRMRQAGKTDAAEMAAFLRERYGDVPLSPPARPPEQPPRSLSRALQEYESQPHDPEVTTRTWQALWQYWGKRLGMAVSVPACDWTEEEIREPIQDTRGRLVPGMLVYRPEIAHGQRGLAFLGDIFPTMRGYSMVRETTPVSDGYDTTGWAKVEATVNAPNRGTREGDVIRYFERQGRQGQRLGTYIIASQFSHAVTGHYFDEATPSRLPGSRQAGGVVGARFFRDGSLYVTPIWNAPHRHPALGARSERSRR